MLGLPAILHTSLRRVCLSHGFATAHRITVNTLGPLLALLRTPKQTPPDLMIYSSRAAIFLKGLCSTLRAHHLKGVSFTTQKSLICTFIMTHFWKPVCLLCLELRSETGKRYAPMADAVICASWPLTALDRSPNTLMAFYCKY